MKVDMSYEGWFPEPCPQYQTALDFSSTHLYSGNTFEKFKALKVLILRVVVRI